MDDIYKIFQSNGGLVTTDSRSIERGSIFFALRGDNFDGNVYAGGALAKGAITAVVDDQRVDDGSGRFIVVEDVLTSLQSLACHHRQRLGIKIVGLTGSNGKTTTKEFLKLTLGLKYKVGATVGNLNNHIGVPLTILSFKAGIEIGIVEMGASHGGEIALLCDIARPDVGVITNIGRAHLEGFGGPDGVKAGKGELFDFLQASGGVAIYNGGDDVISDMVARRMGIKAIGYDIDYDAIKLNIFGTYNVRNAAAAIAVAQYFGVDKGAAIEAVQGYDPQNNRSQILKTEKGNTVIVDCYNANPSSMSSALLEFSASAYSNKVAILGDMKELGQFSQSEHISIVKLSETIGERYFVGDIFCSIGAPNAFQNSDTLAQQLNITNSTILLKGSRSIGLERILKFL